MSVDAVATPVKEHPIIFSGPMVQAKWTDKRWNPTRGCSRVSLGCGGPKREGGCYAEKFAHRFSGPGQPYEGLTRMTENGPRWTGIVRLVPEMLEEPLRWRKPQRIFVNSMSDLFHESLPDSAIDQVFAVMALAGAHRHYFGAKGHTFQILTKRPDQMRTYMADPDTPRRVSYRVQEIAKANPGLYATKGTWPIEVADALRGRTAGLWPMEDVWLGTSVEDQATADERIPLLLQTPAAVRFVSYEPALAGVDFKAGLALNRTGRLSHPGKPDEWTWGPRIDWLIVGGESGPGARPFDVAWARSTVAQCKAAGVPVFVKQLGALPYCSPTVPIPGNRSSLKNRKGGDPSEWPEDLRIREFPGGSRAR